MKNKRKNNQPIIKLENNYEKQEHITRKNEGTTNETREIIHLRNAKRKKLTIRNKGRGLCREDEMSRMGWGKKGCIIQSWYLIKVAMAWYPFPCLLQFTSEGLNRDPPVKFVATKLTGFMGRNLQRFHAKVTK